MNKTPQLQESKLLGNGKGSLRGNTFLVNEIWFRTIQIKLNGAVTVKNLTTGIEKIINFKDLERIKVDDVKNMEAREQYQGKWVNLNVKKR